MKQPGDSFEFLKRIHTMVDENTIHIQQNPRHFDKLFEVVGINGSMHSKKVPCHELMNEPDNTPFLNAEKASKFRSVVGVLLYHQRPCPVHELSYRAQLDDVAAFVPLLDCSAKQFIASTCGRERTLAFTCKWRWTGVGTVFRF